jgi:hypothetical protein
VRRVEGDNVFLGEDCQMCFNEVVKFVSKIHSVMYWVHGMNRGGDKCMCLWRRRTPQAKARSTTPVQLQLLAHVCEVE